jgi:hypothetical protein
MVEEAENRQSENESKTGDPLTYEWDTKRGKARAI